MTSHSHGGGGEGGGGGEMSDISEPPTRMGEKYVWTMSPWVASCVLAAGTVGHQVVDSLVCVDDLFSTAVIITTCKVD